ncbi:hypothetical protein SFR_6075 [Streptomyces sp. FR-008]|nr:hypothetical protein SFR_6075 [Streptomyces sp. FR-008]
MPEPPARGAATPGGHGTAKPPGRANPSPAPRRIPRAVVILRPDPAKEYV